MAEPKQEQNVSATPGEGEVNPTGEPQKPVDDIAAKFAEIEKRHKAELAGLNRKVSELEKAKQSIELSKMTEEERAAKERELFEADRKKFDAERAEYRRLSAVANEGLSPEFAKLISATDPDEITAQVKMIKESVAAEAERKAKAEIAEKFGGQKPTGGTPAAGKTMTRADFEAIQNPMEKAKIAREYKIING